MHNPAMRASLLSCLAWLAVTCAQAGTTVVLRPFVTMSKAHVTLGDVAGVTGESLDEVERLLASPLGLAPRAGMLRQIDRDAIERSVLAHSADLAPRVIWSGARQVTLDSAGNTVSGERILQAARATLQRAGLRPVRETHLPRDIDVPVGEVALSVRPLPEAPVATRYRLVWVDVLVDGRPARSVPVSFSMEASPPAGRDTAAVAVPVRAASSVRPASPVAAAIPAPPSPSIGVVRGEWATLRAGSDAIRLESRVLVLQDGRPGQTVRVRAPGAATAILAQVAGAHELEIGE